MLSYSGQTDLQAGAPTNSQGIVLCAGLLCDCDTGSTRRVQYTVGGLWTSRQLGGRGRVVVGGRSHRGEGGFCGLYYHGRVSGGSSCALVSLVGTFWRASCFRSVVGQHGTRFIAGALRPLQCRNNYVCVGRKMFTPFARDET